MADPLDFEDWYRRERPRLASAMAAISGDAATGAEVADEAFARALERWDRVCAMTSPGGWTYRVALNHLRRMKRRAAREPDLIHRASTRSTIDGAGSGVGGWDVDLVRAVAALPRRQRTAVALHYVADLSVAEVAGLMDIRTGTVDATLHAARANLLRALGPTEPGAEPRSEEPTRDLTDTPTPETSP